MAWGVLLGSLVVRALCRAKQVAEEAGCLCKTYDVMVVQRYRFPKGSSCIPLYCHRNVRVCCMGYQILIYCSALAHIVRHVHPTGMERQTVSTLRKGFHPWTTHAAPVTAYEPLSVPMEHPCPPMA